MHRRSRGQSVRERVRLKIAHMLRRRVFAVAGLLCPLGAAAQRRPARDRPLHLGIDPVLSSSGLGAALANAFARETGLASKLISGASSAVLEALERGEVDATLTLAPEPEQRLEKDGLAHDRRLVALAEFVLVGPPDRRKAGAGDVIRQLSQGAAAGLPFVGRNDGSGAHWLEQALWRAAGVAPAAPWYHAVDSALAWATAREQRASLLLDQTAWRALRTREMVVLAQGEAGLQAPVHVMRSFRVEHPAARLFIAWVGGRFGRRVVARRAGFRVP